MTIEQAYKYFTGKLANIYDNRETANIADWVFENVAGIKRLQRITEKEIPIEEFKLEELNNALAELLEHKPVQYVLGEAWFYKMKLFVNEDVLIPRPETEELIEWITDKSGNKNSKIKILDIGTGSGCIAVALKKELPDAEISGIDISVNALSVAKQNATSHQSKIEFFQLNFLEEIEWQKLSSYDIIVSNPPYISEKERPELKKNIIDFEPPAALFVPDNDKFIFYKKIAIFAQDHLKKDGNIFVEVHENYSADVAELFLQNGFRSIIKKDIYGKNRMISAFRYTISDR